MLIWQFEHILYRRHSTEDIDWQLSTANQGAVQNALLTLYQQHIYLLFLSNVNFDLLWAFHIPHTYFCMVWQHKALWCVVNFKHIQPVFKSAVGLQRKKQQQWLSFYASLNISGIFFFELALYWLIFNHLCDLWLELLFLPYPIHVSTNPLLAVLIDWEFVLNFQTRVLLLHADGFLTEQCWSVFKATSKKRKEKSLQSQHPTFFPQTFLCYSP